VHIGGTHVAFETLFKFEQALGEYTGAPYVVVTDGCTHALELCFRLKHVKYCQFPAHTYISVLMTLRELGINYRLTDDNWVGEYNFYKTAIWDSARRLECNMYRVGQMQCLSFGHSKPLEIGKLGAVLLDNKEDYETLSLMRSDGRDLRISPWQDQLSFVQGYHYCPTLEDCQKGIDKLPFIDELPKYYQYTDLRNIDFAD
jgi:dTDP-4-amino-4,6-dideoxygalactose transaminase